MKRKIPVAAHLTDPEYQLLMTVYAKHNSSMALEERKKHNLGNITKVVRNPQEGSLKVYFNDNGEWWNYSADGTWF
jgi:hypothetical protein